VKKKLIGLGAVVLVLALLLTLAPACGKGGEGPGVTPTPGTPGAKPTPTPQAKELKMGLLTPLSGAYGPFGVEIEQGAVWAVDKINETGGVKVGADTYMVKLVKADDKGIGSEAATQVTKMISQDKIHYLTGPIGTYPAIMPIVKEGKCFSSIMAPTAKWMCSPDNPYMIALPCSNEFWFEAFWKSGYKFHPEIKTVVLMWAEGPRVQDYLDIAQAVHESHGSEVIATQLYLGGSTDYYPVLTSVVAKKPDAIEFNGAKGDLALILKQARELGYKGLIVGSQAGSPEPFIQVAGCAYAEGFINNDPDYNSELYPESTRLLYAEFQKRFPGATMALTTYLSYGSIMLYKQGIERAGSVDPDEVMKVFDDPNFEFEWFGIPGKKLGGYENYGVRRNVQDEVCYSEVVNCKRVMKGREPVLIP